MGRIVIDRPSYAGDTQGKDASAMCTYLHPRGIGKGKKMKTHRRVSSQPWCEGRNGFGADQFKLLQAQPKRRRRSERCLSQACVFKEEE